MKNNMTPNTPSHNEEEIIDEVMKFASNPDYGTEDCRNAIRTAFSTLRHSIESEVREKTGKEIVETLRELKTNCKVYHNETIDTPEKIEMYNQTLEWAKEIVSSLTTPVKPLQD
jgi:hypothetical protein